MGISIINVSTYRRNQVVLLKPITSFQVSTVVL